MPDDDAVLLDRLAREEDRLPMSAALEIVRRGDALGPALVRILRDPASWDLDSPRFWAVVHAYYLLGVLRPPGSIDVLIDAMAKAEDLGLEWVTDEAPEILVSYGTAAVPALQAFALDRARAPFARLLAAEALALLGRRHPETADGIRVALLSLLAEEPAPEEAFRPYAAHSVLLLARPEDAGLLRAAVDGEILHSEDVDDALAGGIELPERPPEPWMSFYSEEAVAERQEEWADHEAGADTLHEGEPPDPDVPPPPLKAAPKVGRNDPCPCGSGRKYKKCCAT